MDSEYSDHSARHRIGKTAKQKKVTSPQRAKAITNMHVKRFKHLELSSHTPGVMRDLEGKTDGQNMDRQFAQLFMKIILLLLNIIRAKDPGFAGSLHHNGKIQAKVHTNSKVANDSRRQDEDEEDDDQVIDKVIKNNIPNALAFDYVFDKNIGVYFKNEYQESAKEEKPDPKQERDQPKDCPELNCNIDRTPTNTAIAKMVDRVPIEKSSEECHEVSIRTEETENEALQVCNDEVSTADPVKEKWCPVLKLQENTDSKSKADGESKKLREGQEPSEEERVKKLWEELLDMKYFRIKPEYTNVYMLSAARPAKIHPKAIGDIPWPWLCEEKWRLHTFSTYPHNTAKSAILLASEGFAYTGSGKDRDDSVICYFCFSTKREWLSSDNIREVHRTISPNCSMVTGVNCNNIPMIAPKNGSGLFSSLLGQHQRSKTGSHGRGGDEIESDSVPEARQESQARTVTEPAPSNKRKPVQMAQSSIGQSSTSQGQAAPRSSSSPTVTTHQATNNNAPSSTVVSGQANQNEASSRTQTQQARSGNNLSRDSASLQDDGHLQAVGQNSQSASSAASSNSTAARAAAAPSSTPTPQSQPTSQGSARPPASSAPPASSTSNTNQTPNTSSEQGNNSQSSSQSSQNTSRPAPGRGPTYGDLGIITERPKRYEYAVRARRLETFEHWPRDHHLKKEDLSSAGFYYAGYGDCARCFYCGGGLRNWEDDDNVWVEHARWFPKCAFIRQQMGQAFVDTVQDLNKDHDQISYKMVTDKMGPNAVSFQLDSNNVPLKRDPAVKTVIDMGFHEKDVLAAAAYVKETNTILSADKLFEKLESDGKSRIQKNEVADSQAVGGTPDPSKDKETMENLKDQNSQLRQQTVCKICMDKEVAVVFLPCGHLVSCTDCAAAMKDCPVCRNHVKGIVRAFMS